MDSCLKSGHLWDLRYDQLVKSERYCTRCGHFFAGEDNEASTLDNAIQWPENSLNHSKDNVGRFGFKKGKIVRR